MIKICTSSFVFKFVGGEPKTARKCHYCAQEKLGGMICVYSNAETGFEDPTIFVCPDCAVRGCKESEQAWADVITQAHPGISKEEIEEALKKGAEGSKELDKKLDQVFRPPGNDLYLR